MINLNDYKDCPCLILNTSFITLNEYIQAERGNKYAAAKIKDNLTNNVNYLARAQKFKLEKGLYDVIFVWYKPNNRNDHDNICFAKKFCLDGIKEAGIIKNDNPKFINNFADVFILDKTRSYISCKMIFINI